MALNTVRNDSSRLWYTHLKHNRAVNAVSKRIKQQPEAAEFVPPQKDWSKRQIPRERKQCRSRWSVTTNYQPQQTGFNLLALSQSDTRSITSPLKLNTVCLCCLESWLLLVLQDFRKTSVIIRSRWTCFSPDMIVQESRPLSLWKLSQWSRNQNHRHKHFNLNSLYIYIYI